MQENLPSNPAEAEEKPIQAFVISTALADGDVKEPLTTVTPTEGVVLFGIL